MTRKQDTPGRNRPHPNDVSDKDTAAAERPSSTGELPAGDERPLAKGELDATAHGTGHPVGRVVGAASGLAAGALSGIAAGPVGSAAGAVAGAAIGALSGGGDDGRSRDKGPQVPEAADGQQAVRAMAPATYRLAFHYGNDAHERFGPGAKWDDVRATLRRQWETERQRAAPSWREVEPAVHDGWEARENNGD
jgi:hypothetical protein